VSQLVLIIEDNEDILELEELHLRKAGFDVLGFLSTKGVEQALEEERVDLLIVDRNLPGVEGSEFVEQLRHKGFEQPVIFVSAKVADHEVEEGFLKGGDDYITKPFNMNELVLRVKARLSRYIGNLQLIKHRDLLFDIDNSQVKLAGEVLSLTSLEFRLLFYLVKNKSRVVSRDELLDEVWKEDVGYKSVNMAVSRLKSKIEKNDTYIEAIRGVGYKIC
jgi:DNA-binding response OmpR family regulator